MHNSVESLFRERYPGLLSFLNSNTDLASALRDGKYDEAMLNGFVRYPNIFVEEAPAAQAVLDGIRLEQLKKPEGYN